MTIIESINVVVNDLNDIVGISSEDETGCLADEVENQLQNIIVALFVAIKKELESEIESSVETTFAIELVIENLDITDPTTKDPPTKIQKNHPTENIIVDLIKR